MLKLIFPREETREAGRRKDHIEWMNVTTEEEKVWLRILITSGKENSTSIGKESSNSEQSNCPKWVWGKDSAHSEREVSRYKIMKQSNWAFANKNLRNFRIWLRIFGHPDQTVIPSGVSGRDSPVIENMDKTPNSKTMRVIRKQNNWILWLIHFSSLQRKDLGVLV